MYIKISGQKILYNAPNENTQTIEFAFNANEVKTILFKKDSAEIFFKEGFFKITDTQTEKPYFFRTIDINSANIIFEYLKKNEHRQKTTKN